MNHLSLFSGIGGIDLAAEWAGMTTVAFVEQNKFCQQVLAKHWPNVPIFDDVRTFTKDSIDEPVDIISGGFPCQPFSKAGKRMGAEDDRHLWPEYLRIIKEHRPAWVVGENVAGIINMELDNVLADLEALGYSTRAFVIPACAVGARHRRERVFIVAYSDSKRLLHSESEKQPAKTWINAQRDASSGSENVADTNVKRLQRRESPQVSGWSPSARHAWSSVLWDIEPNVGRVADGVPSRVDRLKSLGNAVVPQQIYPIFKYIAQIEKVAA